eukprot:CAMPEP_0201583790 /NCGR_PEP_ID=MMETSP0190_2-20130828/102437_1 /ASSEMBLY_ACC=CAM_ASM_000263 /TAXON_ID=37353 /ORGANISM="Rosalina sp." /LENGTH=196 /DNA_ID=CAMNT_0048026341 /DNA_START=122 /DNA_END=712 /DNA_ORIENTATION=-
MDFLTLSQFGGHAAVNVNIESQAQPQPQPTPNRKQERKKRRNSSSNSNASDNNMVSNIVISDINSNNSALRPKGARKKRPFNEAIGDDFLMSNSSASPKRRKLSNDSDDDVLKGLIGREDDLKMGELNNNNRVRSTQGTVTKSEGGTNTQNFINTATTTQESISETQQHQEEMKRREELKKRRQKKKKKKKAKLRI